MSRIIKCKIAEEHDHGSDHLPIETVIALQIKEEARPSPAYNYAKTNWKQLKDKLKSYLPDDIPPLITKMAIDNYAEEPS